MLLKIRIGNIELRARNHYDLNQLCDLFLDDYGVVIRRFMVDKGLIDVSDLVREKQ